MSDRISARVMVPVMAALVLALSAPPCAYAAENPVLYSRQVETVSGAELVRTALSQVQNVEIGSTAATVTVAGALGPSPIAVEYGEVMETVGFDPDGTSGSIMPLLALTFGVSGFVRFLRLILRLAR